MVGTSGYPWPPLAAPSTLEGESQRMHLEAALRALREQRPGIAAEIGEYLYSLVLQGQIQDTIVLATCRRLYDHEQQVAELEASLRTLSVTPPVSPAPGHTPSPANGPPGAPAKPPVPGSQEPPTILYPAKVDKVESDATHIGAPLSPERPPSSVGGYGGGVRSGLPGPRDAPSPALRPADLEAEETQFEPVRRPEPVLPAPGKAAERRCAHCRMPLRATDTICPVCGRPAAEHAAHSPQCRRCGTELRPQDRTCPVCGTPRA